jgi:hypothetical protein
LERTGLDGQRWVGQANAGSRCMLAMAYSWRWFSFAVNRAQRPPKKAVIAVQTIVTTCATGMVFTPFRG